MSYVTSRGLLILSLMAPVCLAGCGGDIFTAVSGNSGTPVSSPAASPTTSIFVGDLASSNQSRILQFARDSQGASAPLTAITLPLGFEINSLDVDRNGQVYVGGALPTNNTTYQWEVLVYAAGASGNAMPVRTILGGAGSFQNIVALTVDASGQVYVVSSLPSASITVLSATANGSAAPLRSISGSFTQLGGSNLGIAASPDGTIYVTNSAQRSLLAFAPGASGNVAPVRSISGSNTGFNGPFGVATDSNGNVYVLDTYENPGVYAASSIYEFSSTSSGNIAPMRTIAGSNTGMNGTFTSYLQIDSTGEIYVSGDRSNVPYVASFGAAASGNVAPDTTFTSSTWSGPGYYGIGIH